MPEAVIVDAIRTPIGRAGKGSLKTVRADELAAIPIRTLIERNPERRLRADHRRADGRRVGSRGAGLQRRAQRGAARRAGPPRSRLHRQPLLRLVADDDPDGVARDPRRRGRPVHRRRGRGRVARRAGRRDDGETKNPKLNGSEGSLYDVYIPMGMTAENVAERCNVTREQQDEWARDLAEPRRRGARLGPLRRRDRAGHRARPQGRPTRRATRSTCPRRSSTQGRRAAARDDDGGAGASCKPAFKPDGTVTAGNACPLNDGAAAVLVMSDEKAARARPRAAGADHRLDRRRDPARDHGPRPDPRDPGAARADRDDDRRHRHRRDQRGVRRADRAVPRRARDPGREAQPVRRRDRARPPVRDDRRADHDHAASTACARATAATGSSRCASPAGWARRC